MAGIAGAAMIRLSRTTDTAHHKRHDIEGPRLQPGAFRLGGGSFGSGLTGGGPAAAGHEGAERASDDLRGGGHARESPDRSKEDSVASIWREIVDRPLDFVWREIVDRKCD